MRRFSRLTAKAVAVLAVGVALSATARAQNVLYWSDGNINASGNIFPQALSSLGITPTTATSEANFVTRIGAGGWDLVILLVQSNFQPNAQNALITYVSGGGKAITADWTQNATLATAFNASFTGALNQNSVTGTADPIWSGVTSPLALTNPNSGYGIFATGLAAGPGGIAQGTFPNGNAAIVLGNGGRTFLNGFLDDTYNASTQASRVTLERNQISLLLVPTQGAIPEPGTVALLASGLLPLAGTVLRRRKA